LAVGCRVATRPVAEAKKTAVAQGKRKTKKKKKKKKPKKVSEHPPDFSILRPLQQLVLSPISFLFFILPPTPTPLDLSFNGQALSIAFRSDGEFHWK
jgi:hypothetical protein